MQYVQLRNGKYQYYRRVPTEVAHLDRRPFVKISLKTDSEEIAKKRVVLVNQATESYWQDLAQHDQGDTQSRYVAAVRLARTFGFPYKQTNDIAVGDFGDLVSRVETVGDKGLGAPVVEALLGGAKTPELTVETALETYWPLSALTREDALTFRDWWLNRICEGGLTPNSANKDINHLSQIISTVSHGLRLGLDNPFLGLRIADSRFW